jgi:hypothetical protein
MRVVLASAAFAGLVACGNSSPSTPPPFGAAGGPAPPGLVTGVGLGGGSSGTQGDGGSTCNTVVQQGDPIDILAFANPAAPPVGGSIPPGTYVLTAVAQYTDTADPGSGLGTVAAKTIVVTTDSFEEVDTDSSGTRRENDSFSASGFDLTRTATCVSPSGGAPTTQSSSYSVTAAAQEQELQLYAPADTTTDVTIYTYTLQ